MEPAGLVSAAVSVTEAGSGLPLESRLTVGEPAISVTGGLFKSADGMNSCTVPITATELPRAADAGSGLDVKTKTPSEVLGLPSASASGA